MQSPTNPINVPKQQSILTQRWQKLRYHPIQYLLRKSIARFNVNPAGRRSGKTELAKRKLVLKFMRGSKWDTPRFFAAAPTRDQAKAIYWDDLKRLVPPWFMLRPPSESELTIYGYNGAILRVLGMDKPERIEGVGWDGGVLDEYGNMKPQTWGEHVRPALSDRKGWCDFIGVPEGRNHYYDLAKLAQENKSGDWAYYHWISADILDHDEIQAAKNDLDELTFQQEYEASFVNFHGRTYYAYLDSTHCARISYNPKQPLIFCFDFNIAPGVATVIQEKQITEKGRPIIGETVTGIIGEVYIPLNSNTPMVCRKLIQDWGDHQGLIYVYGDATGGTSKTSSVSGSDWDLVKQVLNPHFGDRIHYDIPAGNPAERDRVNSVNSRLKSINGKVRLMVDPNKAPHVCKDFEGVQNVQGGSGEIDKKKSPELTHLTDSIGYYVHRVFPVRRIIAGPVSFSGF